MTNNSYLIYGQSYWVLADYYSWKIPQYHDYFLGLRIIDITLLKRKIYVWWNALARNFIFHFKAQNSSMTLTNEKKTCSVLTLVGFSYIPKVWQVWHFIKHKLVIYEEWYFFSENFFSCSLLPPTEEKCKILAYIYHDIQNFPGS